MSIEVTVIRQGDEAIFRNVGPDVFDYGTDQVMFAFHLDAERRYVRM